MPRITREAVEKKENFVRKMAVEWPEKNLKELQALVKNAFGQTIAPKRLGELVSAARMNLVKVDVVVGEEPVPQ